MRLTELSAAILVAVTALAHAQSAPPASRPTVVPSRAELGAEIIRLQQKLDALVETLDARERQRAADLRDLILELRKEIEAHAAGAAAGSDLIGRLDEVAAAVDELKESAAKKDDLRKYVRKPDEKVTKTVVGEELELRTDWLAFRTDEIDQVLGRLAMLGGAPGLSPSGTAVVQAASALENLLKANDGEVRPRLFLRLYWETDRFLDDKTFLTVYAEPELELFVYPSDVDRYLLARDDLRPREQLGFIFKKAALGLQMGSLSLTAGVLQFTYGAGFFINPTNPFTPKYPLDPRREVDGVPAAKLDLALYQSESFTLTLEAAGIARTVPNDVLGVYAETLGFSAMGQLRADTPLASLTAIGIRQVPGDLGANATAFGGIISTTPFGLTLSAEALWTESPSGPASGGYAPELVASLQGFASGIGANGTTYIIEYYHDGRVPSTAAAAATELASAVQAGDAFLVLDRLTRPLNRQNYVDVYLEPSLTAKLRVNLAGLIGLDEGVGTLLRAGFDWELYNFVVHAYGGALFGADDSELEHHPIQAFADLAIFAKF